MLTLPIEEISGSVAIAAGAAVVLAAVYAIIAKRSDKAKVFMISAMGQELLKEELQFMGPVRLKEVEAAQTRIVEIVKQLEEQGEDHEHHHAQVRDARAHHGAAHNH